MSGCPFHRDTSAPGSGSTPHSGYSAPAQAQAVTHPVQSITEEDLQCPVCLRLLHEPTSLPCGHSFCAPCLQTAAVEGRLQNCPLCRTDLPDDILRSLRPNVLLSALIEKFLPQAASTRRAEAAEDHEEDLRRHTMVRQVALQVGLQGQRRATLMVQMAGASRCPMHAGSQVPIGFYVARAVASFPPGWIPEETFIAADATQNRISWNLSSETQDEIVRPSGVVMTGVPVRIQGLRSAAELNGHVGTCGKHDPESGRWQVHLRGGQVKSVKTENLTPVRDDHSIEVVLHFQPRFQIQPARVTLALRDTERYLVNVELDNRLVHH